MAGAPGLAANNPLLNPGAPLSGNALLQAAQALATAQTAPVISGLAQQIGQNNQQSQGAISQVGGYYNQLGQQAQSGVNQEGQIGAGLNSQLSQIGQNEQTQLQGIGQNATDSLLKYAPQSDSQNSLAQPAFQSIAQEIARQKGLAAQGQGAFQSFGATQGANYQGLAASNLGTNALRGQESLHGLAQLNMARNQPLQAKIASEHGLYGADLATALGKLRQQEITNQISRAGLGIKQATAASTIATGAFNRNPSAQGSPAWGRVKTAGNQAFGNNPLAVGSAAWARVQNATGRQWSDNPNAVGSAAWARAMKGSASANGGKAKPLSTPENNHFWQTVGQIEGQIQEGQKLLIDPNTGQPTTDKTVGRPVSEQQLRTALQAGTNSAKKAFDPFMVQVAYELLGYNGSINQSTAATLNQQYGVRGGTYNGQPIKVTPTYQPPTQAQSINGAANAATNVQVPRL